MEVIDMSPIYYMGWMIQPTRYGTYFVYDRSDRPMLSTHGWYESTLGSAMERVRKSQ